VAALVEAVQAGQRRALFHERPARRWVAVHLFVLFVVVIVVDVIAVRPRRTEREREREAERKRQTQTGRKRLCVCDVRRRASLPMKLT